MKCALRHPSSLLRNKFRYYSYSSKYIQIHQDSISTVDRNAKAKEESVVSVTFLFSCFGEEDLLSWVSKSDSVTDMFDVVHTVDVEMKSG
jgi:hypothetical protein